jgi:Flp pilus assembly protein TadB
LFPGLIDLIVRALRSGLPVTEAIVGASHEIGDPVGAEFRLIESAGAHGGATSKACFGKLQSASTRLNSGSLYCAQRAA